MRRMLLTLATVVALVALAQPADAQFKFGAQGAVMTSMDDLSQISTATPDLNGTFGLGARVAFQPPLLPIGVIGQGVYYFPEDVGSDYSYMTYSLAGQLRLPTPLLSPYALAGWQFRRVSAGSSSNTESGAMIGAGVQLNVALSLFLEVTMEFQEEIPTMPNFDTNPIVIKGGLMFG